MAILDKKNKWETRNQNLMALVKRVHDRIENNDIERHRLSQDKFGEVFGINREVKITPVMIDGMPAEWVSANRPHMKKTVILYCHGGGYATGSCIYARTLTTKLAASTSMDVLCFDYRLSPEHPYPAAHEDALKAWDYLMLLGYGANEVMIAGDSAGGNLALSLTLRLKETKRFLPRGLVLMSPWTDMTMSGKSYETRAAIDPILSKDYIKNAISAYVQNNEKLNDPYISPLFGDFTNFPPTYIQVGDNEIFLSDATALYKKLLKAGVHAKLNIQKGMWHVYQMSPFKAAYEAMERNAEFIFGICR
ncbi:MAG: alpha/beta hydrolase [Lachnospiraceae bacterium]|nr:alpha/beta hydrolase [Lachnospiraceae bacterium]